MSELRWDRLRREWTVTATYRMDRPQMPDGWCPFCPGSGRVPNDYDVYLYRNDFPSFDSPPPPMSVVPVNAFPARESWGACDVVLYHPDHNRDLVDLDLDHLVKIALLWRDRYLELFQNKRVKYVLIFDNHGEETGVTIPHPHGQIYAFSLLPPVPGVEMRSAWAYKRRVGRCLHCDLLADEVQDGRRVLFDEGQWLAFVPFAARWPYEVHLYPRRCAGHLGELSLEELRAMVAAMKRLLMTYQNYYGRPFPYMTLFHQAPVTGRTERGTHLHVEFCPIRRSRDKLKYRASCETGAGLFINDSHPEDKAAELRSLLAEPQY
jgi:UDPglucose--hexose-1-phosphate uridylyltransferase